MNENLPPHESAAAPSEAARVLAAADSAPRVDEIAPPRSASDDNFRAAPLAPSGTSRQAASPSMFDAPRENAAFFPGAPATQDDSSPDVARVSASEIAPRDPMPSANQTNAFTSSRAAQNDDDGIAAAPNAATGEISSDAATNSQQSEMSHVAPHEVLPGEDAASTRSARSGIAAQISKVSPRILTALIGIPLVLLVVWQGGALLTGITVLLALTAMRELIVAARKNKTPLVIEWCYFLMLFAMIALWNTTPLWRMDIERYDSIDTFLPEFLPLLHLAWPLLALLLVPVWLLLWGVIRYAEQRVSLSSIALSTLAIFYVALFAFWPLLRDLPNGFALFVLLLGGVWAGDSAAYFAGRTFGKTRLTPLSPGKTREGIIASCVATLLICLLLAGALELDWRHGIAIGILISVFAPLGDLVESLWKRELNVKDLGAILPGHGGVLDRCDSLLLTAPVVFVYALWQAL